MRHLVVTPFYTATLASVAHVSTVDVDTIVMCIVDLGVTKESKMELGVVCDLSAPAVRLLCGCSAAALRLLCCCCARNPLTLRHGSLLPFHLPLFYESGFTRTTCAQSRGTRTLVRRDRWIPYAPSLTPPNKRRREGLQTNRDLTRGLSKRFRASYHPKIQ